MLIYYITEDTQKTPAFQTNKVFYSATTQWLPACNVTKRELNYVDLAAKGLSIGLGVLSCLPKGEFISKNSMIFLYYLQH